jgi:HK97 family phage prohead protease
MTTEQRSFQIRAAQGEEFVLAGRALSYNEVSSNELSPGVRERIMPGAFRDALASDDLDCKALFNHDANQILGRTKNGTLTLRDRADGLYMRVQLDKNNSRHRDIYASVKRQDVSEMSFAFTPDDEDYEDGEYNGVRCKVRNIRKANIFDVSVVTAPFYGKGATQVVARSASKKRSAAREELCRISRATGKSFEQILEERRLDKAHRERADRIRCEIFQTAPGIKVVNRRTGRLTYWEDPEADFVPDYDKCPPEMTDLQLRMLAEAIGAQIRLDNARFAEEERRKAAEQERIKREETEREANERRQKEASARANAWRRGGAII